ncbi:hypothetical protein [Sandarakinorhabdus sp. DWP1-3-1]|uniref:hypothetical protein n=1 Tax=Sandarakinorhabdus sp. DWP1-3-1 TaxID=2804627 RepID=UPI003CF0C8E6
MPSAPPMIVPAAFAAIVFAGLCFQQQLFHDGDTGWHLATGRLILATGTVPVTDPFSFTRPGAPWVTHEWLAEVAMQLAFRTGGWAGLAVLSSAAAAGLCLVLGREFSRWLPPTRALIAMLLVAIVLAPFVLARPHLLAWPILAAWTLLLMRASEAGRAPPLAAAVIMLVWANMHGSFLLGLVLIGPFALEAVLAAARRGAMLAGWASFGIAATIAAMVTPNGLEGLLFPLQVSGMSTLHLIIEWRPTSLVRDLTFTIPLALTVGVLLWNRVRLSPVRTVLLLVLVWMAFAHVRHQAVLGIVGSLLLIRPIAARLGGAPPAATPAARPLSIAVLAGVVAVLAARLALPMPRTDSINNPAAAIAAVSPALRRAAVFNEYNFGGSLIFAGIRPFIDGRADMYGDDFVRDFDRAANGDSAAFAAAARRWDIRWAILQPESPLVAGLQAAGWRRIHADRWAVVYEAVGNQPETPAADG